MSKHSFHSRWGRIFIFLPILFCSVAKGQSVADFSLNSRQGCAPFIVPGFTNLSSGNQLTYLWDFGNGVTSTDANPRAVIYATDGSFTVKLTVTDAGGKKDSAVKKNFITVYKNPSVDFVVSNKAGCVPLGVQFTDMSTAGTSVNSKWEWDFGDGQTSLDKSPSHIFKVAGSFTITLKVTNSQGCLDVNTKTSLINVNERPKASFTSTSASSCNPPVVVSYTNTSTTAGVKSIKWDFGDGSVSFEQNPSHNFSKAGTYPVILAITSDNGCTDSISKPTVIGAVTSSITAPDNICEGASTKFINASTPAIASNFWDFGDGINSIDTTPSKTFAKAGLYVVKLVNNFGGCKDSVTKKISVLPKPVADFSFIAPPSGCTLPVNVSFSSQATSATSYSWNFGDSTTSTSSQPTHSYAAYGTFSVQLKVTAANGCSDTITKKNVVSIVRVRINKFDNLPFAGCAPYQSNFSANITSPNPITSYTWNFGDGQTSPLANPVHNYTSLGSYDVSLKIATANGCTDSLQMKGAIVLSDKPKANFSASPLNACASDSVTFTNLSSGTITSTRWEFGDNTTSVVASPIHYYIDTGYFTVKLLVSNSSCNDSLTMNNYIYVKPPIASFSVLFDCAAPLTRKFRNKSVLAQTFEWSFGDGSAISAEENPEHTYKAGGIYFVRLRVTNGGCFNVYTDTIEVINEIPDFTISSNMVCRNTTMVFSAKNVNNSNIATYSWNFGDSSTIVTGPNPSVNHNYLIAGTYSPALTITDRLGCVQRVQKPANVTVYGPIANFTNPEGTCLNRAVIFTDSSRPTGNHPITYWILNYGDGKTDSSTIINPIFSHTYTTSNSYNVSLIVADNFGCKDTLFRPNAINITNPKAGFLLKDSISCNNSNVNFINQSAGGVGLTYFWDFGDGATETTASPSHAYQSEGTYNISLSIKDKYGCTDTIKKPNAIVVQNAKAIFTMSDSLISCPPAQINFVNKSTYSASLKWDFNDGSFADVQNPSHYFLTARTYNIKLIAYGHGSCADSAVKTVTVKGPSGTIAYDPLVQCGPAAINFTGTAVNNDNSYTWDFGDGAGVTTTGPNTSHVYTSKGKFLPRLILIDSKLQCTVYVLGADSIVVPSISTNIRFNQGSFCDSATLQFFDSSTVKNDTITNHLWTFGDGTRSSDVNPFHTYTSSGVYPVRLILTTAGGCTDSSKTYFVKVAKSPEVEITGPSVACVGQSVTYTGIAKDTSIVKWMWNFGNGENNNTASPPAQVYSVAGDYTVKASATNSSGCTTAITKVLKVNPLPNVDAGVDSAICRGSAITLYATGADSYVWAASPSLSCTTCANPVASPLDTSIYYSVTGKNSLTNCQKTDSVQVKVVQPFKITPSPADTICIGQSVQLSVTGADEYDWSPPAGLSNATIANPVANPGVTTLYTVTGHDYLNCFTDTATIPVIVYPVPVFDIIETNVTIAVGNSVAIKTKSSNDVISWQWLPSTGLSCSNCAEPIATPANTIVYKAFAINEGGCRAEDQITVNVFCNNGNLFIPNSFSPNNDGSNDVFFPRGKGISGVKSLQIFNRWGATVFQKINFPINDPSSGWDGTYNGSLAASDVFVYQIEVICETGQVFSFKGDLSLIR